MKKEIPLSKLSFFTGLVSLIFGFIAIITNHQGFALKLLTLFYFILVLGTVFYLKDLVKNEKK